MCVSLFDAVVEPAENSGQQQEKLTTNEVEKQSSKAERSNLIVEKQNAGGKTDGD